MADFFLQYPQTSGGGGGGGVTSFNSRTGAVLPAAGDYTAADITNIPAGNISATDVQAALNELDVEKMQLNQYGGFTESITDQIVNNDSHNINIINLSIDPTENSPATALIALGININIDPNDSGFDIGTGGSAVILHNNNIQHLGTSDVGDLAFTSNYFNLGNGTDPITVRGVSYSYGFGNINDNVTVTNSLQGYGFQFTVAAGATLDPASSIIGFYDFNTINTPSPGYQSFVASPVIAELQANKSYNAFSINPNISIVNADSSVGAIEIGGSIGTMGENSYYHGVGVNPIIDQARYAAGLQVNMNNVDLYPGVQASVVIQDLTLTAIQPGTFGNTITFEYIGGGTAGAEVVSLLATAFTVQIEDGVSTAQDIADALNAFPQFASNGTVVISGSASNPQVIQAATPLAGGVNAGEKFAADITGNVRIDGDLSFTGGLSIGQLDAYAPFTLVSGAGPGAVASINNIISAPSLAANQTITNADTIGVNTAMLMTIGDNATITTALLGVAALGLPAVISLGSGATVDRVAGAAFALSLDSGAAGGTINEVDLCYAVAIPNGTTTVDRLYGYKMDFPYGPVGTDSWGFYEAPGINNYMAGNLLIGGTAGSDDIVSNDNVALEVKSTTKAIVFSRMTTTERDAMTAINGMVIYNTTTDKLQVRAAGAWADLH